jgi:hypothetical protein
MRPTTPRRWLLAASTGVALLAGGALLSERRERRVLEQTVAGLTQQATTDRARLVGLEAALAGRDSMLATVLAADVVTLRMVAQGERPPGARVYWNRRLGRIAIAANDLPPAPAGRTYQLWGIAAGSPVSLGLFNTAADGSATSSFAIGTALDFQVAAVTEEPAGGSPQPTRTPFLVGTLATR